MKIYTKTGDRGETGLLGPLRVPKDHPRIEAYGAVDELNAIVGLARSEGPPPRLDRLLGRIQEDLFTAGAQLATSPGTRLGGVRPLGRADVGRLERAIDRLTGGLPPLRSFILPGGTLSAALLHVARTVCRRAERAVVTLDHDERVSPTLLVYLNRLSDLLFVLAREANARGGGGDVPWTPRSAKRR